MLTIIYYMSAWSYTVDISLDSFMSGPLLRWYLSTATKQCTATQGEVICSEQFCCRSHLINLTLLFVVIIAYVPTYALKVHFWI